jgi:hypothetical protein
LTSVSAPDAIGVNRRKVWLESLMRRNMYKSQNLCKGAIVILIWNGFSALATVYDSDGSSTNVQYIHDTLAQDGDIITLPAGRFNWTTHPVITKGITLQGQSTATGAGTANAAAVDNTIIEDDTPATGTGAGVLVVSGAPGKQIRITGISFTHGARTEINWNGTVRLSSSGGRNFSTRIDHCHFFNLNAKDITVYGEMLGLSDHNIHEAGRHEEQSYYIEHAGWNGGAQGNSSWADYPYYGSEKFFFIEDNTIRADSHGEGSSIDAMAGARVVIRHNYFRDAMPTNHGTESGPNRGTRAMQVYDNEINATVSYGSAQQRSGTGIWHDNTFSGRAPNNNVHSPLAIYREGQRAATWGFANGDNPWDMNDTDGQGHFVEGQPGFVFDSGTTTSGTTVSGAYATVSDTNKNWAVNQWRGFIIKHLRTGYGGLIQSNTANSITWAYNGSWPNPDRFNAGEAYQIKRVLSALDQNGRGKGDLIVTTNGIPQNPRWTHQALEPCMSWNNIVTANGHAIGFGRWFEDTEVAGRDYYNLGGGFPRDVIPAQVQAIYTSALNGGFIYDHEFPYPHPLVTDPPVPSPTPSATVTPSPTPTPTPQPPTPTPTPTATATATATATPRHTPRPHPSHGPAKG